MLFPIKVAAHPGMLRYIFDNTSFRLAAPYSRSCTVAYRVLLWPAALHTLCVRNMISRMYRIAFQVEAMSVLNMMSSAMIVVREQYRRYAGV